MASDIPFPPRQHGDTETEGTEPGAATASRSRDRGNHLEAFKAHLLVRCPQCGARANASEVEESRQPTFRVGERVVPLRRVTCAACGFARPEKGADQLSRSSQDPLGQVSPPHASYYYLPLWLQTPCAGHVLWAYNQEHLDFIERSVARILRDRKRNGSKSVDDRLPRWIKDTQDSEELLKGVARLRYLLVR